MKTFYTYLWLREDGTPYYVGKGHKGTKDRARVKDNHRYSPPTSDRILIQDFLSEEDAFAAEKFLIAFYGRMDTGTGCLRNFTDGGDGTSGNVMSEEAKRRISAATKGEKNPFFGKKHSLTSLRKMSAWCRSDGTREKMRRAQRGNGNHRGHKHSLEVRQKISDALWQRKVIQIL